MSTEVEDTCRAGFLRHLMKTTDPFDLSPEFCRAKGWMVVPIEPRNKQLAPEDLDRLVPALVENGIRDLVALATEPVPRGLSGFELTSDRDAIALCCERLDVYRFVLTDRGQTFAIAFTEWYALASAASDLLEAMLGQSVAEAREEFNGFLRDLDEPADSRLRHLAAESALI